MGALAVNETGPRPRVGVRAWAVCLLRPAAATWRASRVDNCDDAERLLFRAELHERAEGTLLRVELERADGMVVTAVDRVFAGNRWRDAEEARPS